MSARTAALVSLFVALPAAAKVNVAVMYFDNHTGSREYDVLSKGMADMLITDLAAAEQLQLVERARLEAVLAELSLQRSKYFDAESAVKVGKLVGASHIVTGAFTGFEPEVRIDVRLLEVQTGKVVVTAQVKGKKDAFFDLEQQLVGKFLGALQQKLPAPQIGALGLDAALKYGQSLDTADKGDVKAASTQLASVVRAAPDFALGKARYKQLLERLKSAGQQRDQALSKDEQLALDELQKKLAVPFEKKSFETFFCYRREKAAYLMWKIEQLGGAPRGPLKYRVPPATDVPRVKQLLIELFEHEVKTLELAMTHVELTRNENFTLECAMAMYRADEESQLGTRMGTLQVPRESFYEVHPMELATRLAVLVATGARKRELLQSTSMFRALPVVPMASPAAVKKTLELLDAAQAAGKRFKPFMPDDAIPELELARANLLLNAGRREEGIAVLQSFLDQYPKSKAFSEVAGMVESLLGISDDARTDGAALAACRADPRTVLREVDRLIDAEGAGGVKTRLAGLEPKCAEVAAQVRQAAAWGFLMRADCANAKSFGTGAEERSVVSALCD